jgi:hypothetical protein
MGMPPEAVEARMAVLQQRELDRVVANLPTFVAPPPPPPTTMLDLLALNEEKRRATEAALSVEVPQDPFAGIPATTPDLTFGQTMPAAVLPTFSTSTDFGDDLLPDLDLGDDLLPDLNAVPDTYASEWREDLFQDFMTQAPAAGRSLSFRGRQGVPRPVPMPVGGRGNWNGNPPPGEYRRWLSEALNAYADAMELIQSWGGPGTYTYDLRQALFVQQHINSGKVNATPHERAQLQRHINHLQQMAFHTERDVGYYGT